MRLRPLVPAIPLAVLAAALWHAGGGTGESPAGGAGRGPAGGAGGGDAAGLPETGRLAGAPPPEFVWVSHDWVEEVRSRAPGPRRDRLRVHGAGLVPRWAWAGGCTAAGCRACLIDQVYGAEF